MSDAPVSLRVIFGWDGAGKTTLVDALKAYSAQSGNLIVVGDDGHSDLISTLEDATAANPDAEIVVEADSVLEPIAIAELFYLEGESGEPPDDRFEIRTVATVVDARKLMAILEKPQPLFNLDLQYDEIDDRTDADVVVEQIEFADVVALNHAGDTDAALLLKTRHALEWLNPRAQILEIPPEGVTREFTEAFWRACDLIQFDFEEASEGAGWIQVLANTHPKQGSKIEATDATSELSGLALRGRRPLHPGRFKIFLESLGHHKVVRIKGWIWIATRHGEIGIWNVAGPASMLVNGGAWMAATPMREWPDDPSEREDIMADWIPPYGDRRQEVAVIGFDLNELELRRAFKHCMLTDDEFAQGPEAWAKWPDSLPDWSVEGSDDFDGLLQ